MLLFDYSRKCSSILGIAVMLSLSACQVRPLYSDGSPNAAGVTTSAAMQSVAVVEATTRYGQEVRNQMIFLLGGGRGEPSNPAYSLDLGVTEQVISSANIQAAGNASQPTAGGVVLTSLYVLKNAATGATVSSGKRTVTAPFDLPAQQFASVRAQRDAENRAARELAELVRLAIAADLSK